MITDGETGIEQIPKIYELLFSIDYNVDNAKGMFVIDQCFSFIQWKLTEEIEQCQSFLQNLTQREIEGLCLNIFPGCTTLLHKLSDSSQELAIVFGQVPVSSFSSSGCFEMPFVKDFYGKTPLHYCMHNNKIADIFISFLAGAPLDHHSRQIVDVLPSLIKNNLPSLLSYFDKRMIQTEQTRAINRGSLKKFESLADMGIMTASIWEDSRTIKEGLFTSGA
jgi:hypothetical protein